MIRNQLSRRNLLPEQISYLRGKRYNLEKTAGHGAKSAGQNDPQIETAERLGAEYKVAPSTIKRDASFASAIDTLALVVGNCIRPDLLSRNAKLSKKHTLELASLEKESPDLVKEVFSDKTGEILDVVERIKRRVDKRANIPFPFRVGEVCIIQPQSDKELRQYKGCWAIVKKVYEFSCLVTVWDGEIVLGEKNLKSLEYTETEREEKRMIAQRLANIIKAGGMEEALISANLKFLGSLQRSYLTPVEERLLSSIERIVGME